MLMAEASRLERKIPIAESSARTIQGRWSWITIALVTVAVLLMGASVLLLQRRFNLTRYLHRSEIAAAAAKGGISREDPGTLRRIEKLERELRELRSLMPGLPINGKRHGADDDANKMARNKRRNADRHRPRGGSMEDPDVTITAVDVKFHSDAKPRSITGMWQPLDTNNFTGNKGHSSKRGWRDRWMMSTEMESALRARFGPREEGAENETISFTPLIRGSSATTSRTIRSELRQTTTTNMVSADNSTTVSGDVSGSGYTRSHRRNIVPMKRKIFNWYITTPSVASAEGNMTSQAAGRNMTSQAALSRSERLYENDATNMKGRKKVGVQKHISPRDDLKKFAKKLPGTDATDLTASSQGMPVASATAFRYTTKNSRSSAKLETDGLTTRSTDQAPTLDSEIQKGGENWTKAGYLTSEAKKDDTIRTTSCHGAVVINCYPKETKNSTLKNPGSPNGTQFISGSSNYDATASAHQRIDQTQPVVTHIIAYNDLSMENDTLTRFRSSTSRSSGLKPSYFEDITNETGELTVSTATGTGIRDAVDSSEQVASYAPGFSFFTSVEENFTAALPSMPGAASLEVIRPLGNFIAGVRSSNASKPTIESDNYTGSMNNHDNQTVDDAEDATRKADQRTNDTSVLNLAGLSLSRGADNVKATTPGRYVDGLAAWSNEWTNGTDVTWNNPSTNYLISTDSSDLNGDVSPLNVSVIAASSQANAGMEFSETELNVSEAKNSTFTVPASATTHSVDEDSMLENSTITSTNVKKATFEVSTNEHSVTLDLTIPPSVQPSRSLQIGKGGPSTEDVPKSRLDNTTAIRTSKRLLPLLTPTGAVFSTTKFVLTTVPSLEVKLASEIQTTPESLLHKVVEQSNTMNVAFLSSYATKDELGTEVNGQLVDTPASVARKTMDRISRVPLSQGSLRNSEETTSVEMPKHQERFNGAAKSSPVKHELERDKNKQTGNNLVHTSELATSKDSARNALDDLYSSLKSALEEERKQRQNMIGQEMLDYYETHGVNSSYFTVSEDDVFPTSNIGDTGGARIHGGDMSTLLDRLTSLNERGSDSMARSTAFRRSFWENLHTRKVTKAISTNVVPKSGTKTLTNNVYYNLSTHAETYEESRPSTLNKSSFKNVSLRSFNDSPSKEYITDTPDHMEIHPSSGRESTLLPSPGLKYQRESKKRAVKSDNDASVPFDVTYAGVVTEKLSAQGVTTIQQAHAQTSSDKLKNSTASETWRSTDNLLHADKTASSLNMGNKTKTHMTASSREARFHVECNKSAAVTEREMSGFRRPGVVCMYNASHSGWQSEQAFYNLASFPYEYCSSVLYCCLSLKEELDIEEFGNHTDLQYLTAAKKQYHGLKTFVAIGVTNSPTASFRHLVSNQVHQDIFVQLTARWMQTRHFDGAYLYWPEMQDSDYVDGISAFHYLAKRLNKLRLKLGIILPGSNLAFAKEAVLEAVTKYRDGIYDQILLSPPDFYEASNGSTLPYHREWLARAYDTYPANLPGPSFSFCPMIPFWGRTFTMKATLKESNFVLRPIGHGAPRHTSGEPGKVAYFEICRELNNSKNILATREQFMKGNEYVTILTPASLERHLLSMMARKPWQCFGSWGVEWDDFGGRCGSIRYPLLKTLSEFQVNHPINIMAVA